MLLCTKYHEALLPDVIHLVDNWNKSKNQVILKMECDTYLKKLSSLVQKTALSQNLFRYLNVYLSDQNSLVFAVTRHGSKDQAVLEVEFNV